MEEAVLKTVNYFSFFSYAPAFEEIYTFFPLKTTKRRLGDELKKLVEKGLLIKKIVSLPQIFNLKFPILNSPVYTLPPHRIFLDKRVARARLSQKKVEKIRPFLDGLKIFSQIQLIGLSGAISMANAKKNDDVDLFIITAGERLFTGRCLAIATADIFGVRRQRRDKKPADKVCLNLFFDAADMGVARAKRNLYVAHELLQMKPLVVKANIYDQFLSVNDWVTGFFPNALKGKLPKKGTRKIYQNRSEHYLKPKKYIGDAAEYLLQKLQLSLISKHRTTELIGQHQLWFFPQDFEKKMRKAKAI